jgi:hypothetical protein
MTYTHSDARVQAGDSVVMAANPECRVIAGWTNRIQKGEVRRGRNRPG